MSRLILGVATATMFMIGTAAITTAQTDGAATEATQSDTMTEQSDRQPTSRSDRKREWQGERMRGQRGQYSDRRQRSGHHHGWMMKGERMPMMPDHRGYRLGQRGGMHSGGPGGGWGMMSPH